MDFVPECSAWLFLIAARAAARDGCLSLSMQDLTIFFLSVGFAILKMFNVFSVKCLKLLFRSWSLFEFAISFLSRVKFAACEVDAFNFFIKEVLRLFDCVNRVAMQETGHVSAGGRAVVFACFIIP